MIRIMKIHVEEFRGIRKLDLDMAGKRYGICGPNGTGKSGVVDAIEFGLTGDVTRLSGQGRGDLSVKEHAPHVDEHDHPEKSFVVLDLDIPSLGKSFSIRRSVANPRKPTISSSDAGTLAVVDELQRHPEFALSRREIVKYIITPPGQRSVDVQTLLRLERLEKMRKLLSTFANQRKTEAGAAARLRAGAQADLCSVLGISSPDEVSILTKANAKRTLLGLPELQVLTETSSLKAGIATTEAGGIAPLRRAVVLADLASSRSAVEEGLSAEDQQKCDAAASIVAALRTDAVALRLARQYEFIEAGLGFVGDDSCPLCDVAWDRGELEAHLTHKLGCAKDAGDQLRNMDDGVRVVLDHITEQGRAIQKVADYCQRLGLMEPEKNLRSLAVTTDKAEEVLSCFLQDHRDLDSAAGYVAGAYRVSQAHMDDIQVCVDAAQALPDVSPEDEAREILVVAQERFAKYIAAVADETLQSGRHALAQSVLGHYNASCTAVLEGIFDSVAADFGKFYCVINSADESAFDCSLESAPAKLNLDVDFYGRGKFPPGAYHSEGHQDGMGLCLYLALMKHTLGDKFTFAVLDDVLMSVDADHRREVCRLLMSEFPKTQFILTTHDRVWLQYMKTEGLIERSQVFGGWTVDGGPTVWRDEDVWAEIDTALAVNDVARAAWLLRRYLEYTATVLADNLRARIEYRGDGHYDLGDLLPPALKAWRERLTTGEDSARKWGLAQQAAELAAKREEAKALIAAANVENWAINPSVHFNSWANLQSHEFRSVADTFSTLLQSLRCTNDACKSYYYVSPKKGAAEEMRCNCGMANINLKMPREKQ